MLVLFLACATDPALQLEGDVAEGARSYEADCVLCHGPVGEGSSRGSALASSTVESEEILEVVRFGRGDMPAFDYDDQALADLLAHLSTL